MEVGTMRAVFSDNILLLAATALGDTADLTLLHAPGTASASVPALTELDLQTQPEYFGAVKSLRDVDYLDEKKALMTLAASKWIELLSIDWSASSVGQQIAMDLQSDPSGDAAEHTLRAVFGVKSPATVLKRAASLRQS